MSATMVTREMVIEKLSSMFRDPDGFRIFHKTEGEYTKYSIGRIEAVRKSSTLTIYGCFILSLDTELPQNVCEEVFKYMHNEYEKRKE